MTNNIVEIEDLVFSRGRRMVLDRVSLNIPQGSVVAIMGPSGVGKTTVLHLISGHLMPDSGSVNLFSKDVARLSRNAMYELRREVGVLLQNGALFTDLTVFENVATPLREHTQLPEALIRRQVMIKLSAVGLGGTEELMPSELSGGMARRVALARAVVLDPKLMLYDEPMTGLDPIAVSTVRRLIRETNDTLGMTSIIVTHNVSQMLRLADFCYILVNGKIAGAGRPDQLLESEDPGVRQFMNGTVEGPIPFQYTGPENWSLAG